MGTVASPINLLKGLAQAKIIKKSVILFRVLNMTIWCKHVHRLELQFFIIFCDAHSPVKLDIEMKFPHFLFLTWLSIIRNQGDSLFRRCTFEHCATPSVAQCSNVHLGNNPSPPKKRKNLRIHPRWSKNRSASWVRLASQQSVSSNVFLVAPLSLLTGVEDTATHQMGLRHRERIFPATFVF